MSNLFRAILIIYCFIFSTSVVFATEVDFEVDITGDVCLDGVDNDLDGLIDYPNDPDCESVTGDSEGVYVPPEPDPEPEETSSGGSSGLGFFERIDDLFSGDEGDAFIDVQDSENPEIIEKIIDTIENVFKPISFTFDILDPRKHQEIVSEIPSNDPGAEKTFKAPVRFTLPADPFEQRIQNQGESIVFQGPILVTFFDVEVNPIVVTSSEQVRVPVFVMIGIFTLIGLSVAARYTMFEFTKEGIEEEIYHPCNQKIVFSVSSIIFVFATVILIRTLYQPSDIMVFQDDLVQIQTNITTNNKIQDQDLLIEYRVDEEVVQKELVRISSGFGLSTYVYNPTLHPQQSTVEVFVSRDAFNKFIGTYNIEHKKYSPHQLSMVILIIVIFTLILECLEFVFCRRKTKEFLA